jgi:hypothetical protein
LNAETVIDQNGAIVPKATVTVKGESGQEFNVNTSENGKYRIPAVANGLYSVTITAAGFKTFMASNVKVFTKGVVFLQATPCFVCEYKKFLFKDILEKELVEQ